MKTAYTSISGVKILGAVFFGAIGVGLFQLGIHRDDGELPILGGGLMLVALLFLLTSRTFVRVDASARELVTGGLLKKRRKVAENQPVTVSTLTADGEGAHEVVASRTSHFVSIDGADGQPIKWRTKSRMRAHRAGEIIAKALAVPLLLKYQDKPKIYQPEELDEPWRSRLLRLGRPPLPTVDSETGVEYSPDGPNATITVSARTPSLKRLATPLSIFAVAFFGMYGSTEVVPAVVIAAAMTLPLTLLAVLFIPTDNAPRSKVHIEVSSTQLRITNYVFFVIRRTSTFPVDELEDVDVVSDATDGVALLARSDAQDVLFAGGISMTQAKLLIDLIGYHMTA